jgi:phage-related holin
MNKTNARFGAYRIAFLITLVLLVIEYVLGIISNLEVQLPGNLPGGNA